MVPHECKTCCYWSELIAKTRCGVLVAMCLCDESPRAWRYVRDSHGCERWVEATDGAIDGDTARAIAFQAEHDRD